VTSFSFLHAADIHLDSPLRGLERYEGAPVDRIRGATRAALRALVDLAIAEEVRLVLLAGDLHDVDWRDYNTGLFFVAQMARLNEKGIRVALVSGNHDAASEIARHLTPPANVTIAPIRRPGRTEFPDLNVVVHAQGFATRHCPESILGAWPPAERGALNIGLLHTSAAGHPAHEPYAPCTLDELAALGYDYWALGHVHERRILRRSPWIVYPGNPQGRHIREPGPRGAYLVRVEEGRIGEPEFRALDVLRWESCAVEPGEAGGLPATLDAVRARLEGLLATAEDRTLAVRVVLAGATAAHAELVRDQERTLNEIRGVAVDLAGEKLWIESVRCRTRSPVALADLMARDDAIGGLLRSLENLQGTPEAALAAVQAALAPLEARLPPDLRRGPESLQPEDPEALRTLIEEVQQSLAADLLAEEEA
jgi:DNA repair protein SbcD/Mre11